MLHVETTWRQQFSYRFNVEFTWCVFQLIWLCSRTNSDQAQCGSFYKRKMDAANDIKLRYNQLRLKKVSLKKNKINLAKKKLAFKKKLHWKKAGNSVQCWYSSRLSVLTLKSYELLQSIFSKMLNRNLEKLFWTSISGSFKAC